MDSEQKKEDSLVINIENEDVKFNKHNNGFYTASCKFKGNYTTFTYHDKDIELWGRGYSKNTLYSLSNGEEKRIADFKVQQVTNENLNKIYHPLSFEKKYFDLDDGDDWENVLSKILQHQNNSKISSINENYVLSYDDKDCVYFHLKEDISNIVKNLPNSFISEIKNEFENTNDPFHEMIQSGLVNDVSVYVARELNPDSNKYYVSLENFIFHDMTKESFSTEEFKEAMNEFSKVDKKIEQRLG
jgi:hypothetical protein